MNLERLQDLLDAYGARTECWPEHERSAALALLEASPSARERRAEAAGLDGALDALPAVEPSADLLERIVDRLPGEADPRSPAHRAHATSTGGSRGRRGGSARGPVSLRWKVAATLIPLAAAASLTLWLAPADRRSPRVQLSEANLQALGRYTTATDSLLAGTEVGELFSAPSFGCEEGSLGCPDAVAPAERRSGSPAGGPQLEEAIS